MLSAVAALALWTGLFHPGERHHVRGDLKIDQYQVADWRVNVVEDRFSGEKHCSATRSGVAYDHGVLTFYFPKNLNTANALFRVDWGDSIPVATGAIAAAGLGAHVEEANFSNPSNGEVFIPAVYVGDGSLVAIKPSQAINHRVFFVKGLTAVIASIQSRGCPIVN